MKKSKILRLVSDNSRKALMWYLISRILKLHFCYFSKINVLFFQTSQNKSAQTEKSVHCHSLQPARYRSGCNPWVMPVLPISTVSSVCTPLGRYWLNTGAVLLFSAGKQPTFVYCQASVQHWISTGAVPPFRVMPSLSIAFHCRQTC